MFKFTPLWFAAEIAAFWIAVNYIGFWDTMAYWYAPCLIGFLVTSSFSRKGLLTMQSTLMSGSIPEARIIHAAAVFFSGILFWVPSIGTRVLALALFLPGTRHLILWKFKSILAKKMRQGASGFTFQFGNFGSFGGAARERDVTSSSSDVLDVTPIEVTHSTITSSPPKPQASDSN